MLHHRYALLTTVLLGFTSLAPAAVLTGRVVGPTGTPVSTVDIDVENAATGVALTTPGDNTNALGVFRFAVPAGTYNIAYLPPFAARLADRKVFNVTVSEPTTNLGDVRLARGNLVTGRVVGPGGVAINGVDMDVENSTTGERIPTHSDHSDLTGRFSFLVPAGTVDVVVLPPKAARRAATILSGVDVTGDISLGTIQVEQGFLVSGQVRQAAAGVANVDIDVIDTASGELIPTVEDNTDAGGNYSVVVPAGTFRFEADPPIGAALSHGFVSNVAVSADRALNIGLAATPIAAQIGRSGRLAEAGAPYHFSVTARSTSALPRRIAGRIIGRDPISGVDATLIGPLNFTLPARFGPATAGFTYNVPVGFPPGLRNRALELEVEITDARTGRVFDHDITRVWVP